MNELYKYQQLDIELKKIEKKFTASEYNKKIHASKETAKKSQMRMLTINEEAKKLAEEINKITQVKAKGLELVKKYTETNLDNLDEKTCIDIVNKIKPIMKNLDELITRLNILENSMKKYLDEFDNCKKQVISSKKVFDENKVELDKLKQQVEPETVGIKEAMLKQEKNINPELLQKYKNAKREGVFPVIVKLTDGKNCGYCRMAQSIHKLDDIKTKGYTECEQCHRINIQDEV